MMQNLRGRFFKSLGKITYRLARNFVASTVTDLGRWYVNETLKEKFEKLSTRVNNAKLTEKFLSEIKSEGNLKVNFEPMAPNGFYDAKTQQIVISDLLKNNPFVLAHEYGHYKVGFTGKIFNLLRKKYPQLVEDSVLLELPRVVKFSLFLLFKLSPLSDKLSPIQKALLMTLILKGATLLEELEVNIWALYKAGKEDLTSLREGIPLLLLAYSTYLTDVLFEFLETYFQMLPIIDD